MLHMTRFDTVAPERINQECQFDQSSHCCPNPSCTGGQWNVENLSVPDQLWRVSSETGGSYLVAGVTPACPWCGADLMVVTKSGAEPCANGFLQPMGGMLQPQRAETKLQWNYTDERQKVTLFTAAIGYFLCCS